MASDARVLWLWFAKILEYQLSNIINDCLLLGRQRFTSRYIHQGYIHAKHQGMKTYLKNWYDILKK